MSLIGKLEIEGFRGFDRLSVSPLRKVNLFVGGNNSGKTSLLEAVELLASQDKETACLRVAQRRGDSAVIENRPQDSIFLVGSMLHGYPSSNSASVFSLKDPCQENHQGVTGAIHADIAPEMVAKFDLGYSSRCFVLSDNHVPVGAFPIASDGWTLLGDKIKGPDRAVLYLSADGPALTALAYTYGIMRRNSQFLELKDSLQPIEQTLESVEILPHERRMNVLDFYGRVSGQGVVALRSMGDGIRRLLSVILTVHTCGGVALIDEIENGLHHTNLKHLWQEVFSSTTAAGVQLFASTHSQDCVLGLLEACRENEELRRQTVIHRLVQGHHKTISYSEGSFDALLDNRIEVR